MFFLGRQKDGRRSARRTDSILPLRNSPMRRQSKRAWYQHAMNSYPKIIRIGAGLSVIAALLAFLVRAAEAQTPAVQRLSLGDAARMAAAQTAGVQSAQARVDEAQARVRQSRADQLPQL